MNIHEELKKQERAASEKATRAAATGDKEGAKRLQGAADLARWQRAQLEQ